MHVLTLTIGAPGSGKSTWAEKQPARVISTDALRAITNDRQAISDFFEWVFCQIAESLTHESVVLDSCAVHPRIREQAVDAAHAASARAVAVVFDTDVVACCDAQHGRTHPVPLNMVRSMHAAAATITDMRLRGEGFDDVQHVRRASTHVVERECRQPLCGAYAEDDGFCAEHSPNTALGFLRDDTRLNNSNRQFRRMRYSFLVRQPMCAVCISEPATVLDHIVPHRGISSLFWDQSNWQGLCVTCHGRKTAREVLGRGTAPVLTAGAGRAGLRNLTASQQKIYGLPV